MVVLLGGIFIGESPLSPVQLLWVNLIMDTFAAIALATEPPLESVTSGMPYRENNPVITKFVWRQIIGVSVWNTLIILFMLFAMVFGEDYMDSVPKSLECSDTPGEVPYCENAEYKQKWLTKIFNVFVFL
jgi:magnesium-transporting ATPase (P-type)